MADDGINVHGAYIKVLEKIGAAKFLCEISHRQQAGLKFADSGDKVMFTSRETILPIFETTVTNVDVLNEKRMIITVAEVPDNFPDVKLSLENLTWYPDVILRDNIIRDNRARSALISTKGKVLIERNLFSSQMAGILIEGDNNSWYESGGVLDITINNNVFENIGYGDGMRYPLHISPKLRSDQRLGNKKYHHNIRFTNNKIKSFNGLLVHALSVKGLTVTGNTIERSTFYPSKKALAGIDIKYGEDVLIEKNEFIGFEKLIDLKYSSDSEDIRIKNNEGLIINDKVIK